MRKTYILLLSLSLLFTPLLGPVAHAKVSSAYKTPVIIDIPIDGMNADRTRINKEWADFIVEYKPYGVILNQYHFIDKNQARKLISDIKKTAGYDIKIATDRETGRVDRMFWGNPLAWNHYPSPEEVGTRYVQLKTILALPDDNYIKKAIQPDLEKFGQEVEEIYDKMMEETAALGINMLFAPDCDIKYPDSNPVVIGTRSFGSDPETVSKFARIFIKSALKHGFVVVPKHMPGHGRGVTDSHFGDVVVKASKDELLKTDMVPFIEIYKEYGKTERVLFMMPHIIYTDIDSKNIATKSPKMRDFLHKNLGDDIILVSDDLSMHGFLSKADNKEQISADILITGVGKNIDEVKAIADKFMQQR